MFEKWGNGGEPPDWVTKEECQKMIDDAMAQHNRRATLISIVLGSIALIGYADGMLRIIQRFK